MLNSTRICLRLDPSGCSLQQNPEMMAMMSGMQDPSYREAIEGKLQNLKNDPELEKIMKEIETGGPAAMMKCARLLTASPYTLHVVTELSSGNQRLVCQQASMLSISQPLSCVRCLDGMSIAAVCDVHDERYGLRRYWNDPDVLKKLGTAMGDMPVPGAASANGHAEEQAADADGEEEADEDEEATVHSAASTGERACALRPCLTTKCTIAFA